MVFLVRTGQNLTALGVGSTTVNILVFFHVVILNANYATVMFAMRTTVMMTLGTIELFGTIEVFRTVRTVKTIRTIWKVETYITIRTIETIRMDMTIMTIKTTKATVTFDSSIIAVGTTCFNQKINKNKTCVYKQ